jgi:DNA repair exonuclease SbcCD ATPase subunit
MRLRYIKISGFRGFREPQQIEVPRGFLVVTGRNGAGKSTVCDAIEFVLTGTIDKYTIEKGGKESLADYIWWRGDEGVAEHYVTVAFGDDQGRVIEVTRSREGGVTPRALAELEEVLCEAAGKPPDALKHLCKTSIIRDEMIAATSLDLTDPARFEFVRSALGAVAHGDVAARVKKAAAAAQAAAASAEKEADLVGGRLRTTLAELSDAQVAASRAVDLDSAIRELRRVVGDHTGTLAEVLAATRRYVARRRATLSQTGALPASVRENARLKAEVSSDEFRARQQRVAERRGAAAKEYQSLTAQLDEAEASLTRERQNHAAAASLSALLDLGSQLGLDEGHCPLCRAERRAAEWASALDGLKARIAGVSTALAEANTRVAALRPNLEQARRQLEQAQAEAEECERMVMAVGAREREVRDLWQALTGDDGEVPAAEDLEPRIASERDKLIEVERHMLVLEASQAIERVGQLEALVETIRTEVDSVGNRVASAQSAAQTLDAAEKAVRRVNDEMVDERLAALSPLLSELYYRLRPHQNWREIDYKIRGDVRRFLSLRVGEGLNPQFIFSSGQRRAAGLAFLLAVHLSRPWCEWRTIVLDDPVQHIDDFRALQLVEVLSALRKTDRQVLCAVEDPALADVLCRRFRSTSDSPGARVELDYNPIVGSQVVHYERIQPFPSVVLRSAGAA